MYTVGQVAALCGISVSTLRAWERRYGLVSPQRSEARYRLYDDEQVQRVRRMAVLVGSGVPARRAAEAVMGTEPPTAADVAPVPPPPGGAAPGSPSHGRTGAPGRVLVDAVVAGATDAELRRLVEQHAGGRNMAVAMDDWLAPELRGIGMAWHSGEIGVGQEHVVSYAVMRWLSATYDRLPEGTGPGVVLGLAPGVRHEIGLLAAATALRQRGVRTAYLGADVPLLAWRQTVVRHTPRAVVTAATTGGDVRRTRELVDLLHSLPAAPSVWVGGERGHRAGGRPTSDSMVEAVTRIIDDLHAPGRPR